MTINLTWSLVMSLFEIFSKRQKRLRGEISDVYQYDILPDALRVQIVHIMLDTLGKPNDYVPQKPWEFICETLAREYGVFSLNKSRSSHSHTYHQELIDFFLEVSEADKALDVIELSFQILDRLGRKTTFRNQRDADSLVTGAIHELNARFKEHSVGYQFEAGEIIRVDSQFLHAEVVKPALQLLNAQGFAGPQDEFLRAHEHYRHGNAKEALNECLKSFESMMKVICLRRGWTLNGRETASNLIKICFDNQLIPVFWQSHFTSLRSLLESAVPTGRNNLAGHGQGAETTSVPDHLVAYMLHMTGACLVFLAESEEAL
ncbi:STM4504/CBY_0614 family protein [Pseudomonas sp. DSP3-2-2]|uniref:STM4504/CBY_0614 family protein n=1 Tax=unclassified Pseudomonas TaxID=196821 RepID=UPI003CE87FC8